ncbi:hypothetical protein VTL71DRAFT_4531 [Oculimacula yallundae]|uniref:Uncharacterized protein n=1 Tax=Oculimacula yallundae TaxID=86028 RepID=A0ABR4C3D7_9HELO
MAWDHMETVHDLIAKVNTKARIPIAYLEFLAQTIVLAIALVIMFMMCRRFNLGLLAGNDHMLVSEVISADYSFEIKLINTGRESCTQGTQADRKETASEGEHQISDQEEDKDQDGEMKERGQ